MKNNFVIITENTCDLSQEYIEKHNIIVLPVTYTIDDVTYDGSFETIPPTKELYKKISKSDNLSTAEKSVEHTLECYKELIENGQSFLHISFSSKLGKCYENAMSALKILDDNETEYKGYCIDSKSASLGQGLLIDLAVNMRIRGKSLEKVRDAVEEKKYNLCHYFTVDSLEHLFKGGRLTKTSKIMGTIFAIKPILCMNEEGELMKIEKVHGRKAALDVLITRLALKLSNAVDCPYIYIAHADCEKDAEYVKEEIFKKYKLQTKVINKIGPVIGIHTGASAIALFFFGSDRKEEAL